MTTHATLAVGKAYDIHFGTLNKATHVGPLRGRPYAGYVLMADENTARHCLERVKDILPTDVPVKTIVVGAGERHKNIDTCQEIWRRMFELGAGRRWCCVNVGGGVIGDMGGFAASTFKRGMAFVQVPTTLLSQVDASVGGKLGIDFYSVKNSVGLFADPKAVWVDPAFLDTLPWRELRSGYAEVVKHALIADYDQWTVLREIIDLQAVDWMPVIRYSVDIKRRVVEEDPFEFGLRKALNFGHTIGHAVESYFLGKSDDPLLHGEAIAIGMIAESYLSRAQLALMVDSLEEIAGYLISIYGHRPVPESSFPELIGLMRQDKKNDGSEINFTLLEAPGRVVVNQTATEEMIRRSLRYYNSLRRAD